MINNNHNSVLIGLLLLLFAVFCVQRSVSDGGDDLSSDPIFGNVIEGFVKDLFKKEMKTVDNANMTDCMTRLLCEQICQRTVSGQITEPLIDSQEIMGKDMPQNLPYLFSGGDQGYEYGQSKRCDKCALRYQQCTDDKYESALDMTNDYINKFINKQ